MTKAIGMEMMWMWMMVSCRGIMRVVGNALHK